MGLDMYLTGKKFFWTDWSNPEANARQDGFEIQGVELRLGYWRKHPDLHGYIVRTFGGGIDDCSEIKLSESNIQNIIDSIKNKDLPHTEGFFFGASSGSEEEDKESVTILENALNWLKSKVEKESREIIYRASW